MINEFVMEAMRCKGLADTENSSLGVPTGCRIELLNGLGAAEDVVVLVGVVPGSDFGLTRLNAEDCLFIVSSTSRLFSASCCSADFSKPVLKIPDFSKLVSINLNLLYLLVRVPVAAAGGGDGGGADVARLASSASLWVMLSLVLRLMHAVAGPEGLEDLGSLEYFRRRH